MSKNETAAVEVKAGDKATNDAGRVRIGGGAIHYDEVRTETKDAGRTKIGGGAICF